MKGAACLYDFPRRSLFSFCLNEAIKKNQGKVDLFSYRKQLKMFEAYQVSQRDDKSYHESFGFERLNDFLLFLLSRLLPTIFIISGLKPKTKILNANSIQLESTCQYMAARLKTRNES